MPSKKASRLKKSRKLNKVKPLSLTTSLTPVLTAPTGTPIASTNINASQLQTQPTAPSGGSNNTAGYDIATNKPS